jgi:hypothetical protein
VSIFHGGLRASEALNRVIFHTVIRQWMIFPHFVRFSLQPEAGISILRRSDRAPLAAIWLRCRTDRDPQGPMLASVSSFPITAPTGPKAVAAAGLPPAAASHVAPQAGRAGYPLSGATPWRSRPP